VTFIFLIQFNETDSLSLYMSTFAIVFILWHISDILQILHVLHQKK